MRLVTFLPTALLLLGPVPTAAQDWMEYQSRQDLFTVSIPGQPTVSDIKYTSPFAPPMPARVHSVEGPTGRYSVTVVDYSSNGRGAGGAVVSAAWGVINRKADTSLLSAYRGNTVGGLQLTQVNPDGSSTISIVQLHERRLYILEATVPKGARSPDMFQQSFRFLDQEGKPVWYETTYASGQPVPRRTAPPAGTQSRGQ